MTIKGSLFVDLPKTYQKPSAGKKVLARTSNRFCVDSRASSGQNKRNTRTPNGQKTQTRTYEDKPRTVLGQAEAKKGLANGQPPRESAI